jgi:hypothetical protein
VNFSFAVFPSDSFPLKKTTYLSQKLYIFEPCKKSEGTQQMETQQMKNSQVVTTLIFLTDTFL